MSITLEINKKTIKCELEKLQKCCSFFDNKTSATLKLILDIPEIPDNFDRDVLSRIFNGYQYEINENNIKDVVLFSRIFQIYELEDIEGYSKVVKRGNNSIHYDNNIFSNDETTFAFKRSQELVSCCNSYNLDQTVSLLKIFALETSCRELVKIIYFDIISKKCCNYHLMEILLMRLESETNLYFKQEFINLATQKVIQVLLLKKCPQISQEVCYICRRIIDNNLLKLNNILGGYLSRHPMFVDIISYLDKTFRFPFIDYYYDYEHNIPVISENNFQLHKENINNGKNPNPLCLAIMNDNVYGMINNELFDPKGKIHKSAYEACSLPNENVPIISYAAFYGAINCVSYLINQNITLPDNVYSMACASGNKNIIDLLSKYQVSKKGSLNVAIQCRQQEIIEYLYETYPLDDISSFGSDAEPILDLCFIYGNYEALFYFVTKLSLIDSLLVLSAKNNNNPLTLWSLKLYYSNRRRIVNSTYKYFSPLGYAAKNYNLRLIKVLFDESKINFNQYCDDIDVNFSFYKVTPFLICCKYSFMNENHHKCLQLFFENPNVNVYYKSRTRFIFLLILKSALHYLCQYGRIEDVKLLLTRNFDVNDTDANI